MTRMRREIVRAFSKSVDKRIGIMCVQIWVHYYCNGVDDIKDISPADPVRLFHLPCFFTFIYERVNKWIWKLAATLRWFTAGGAIHIALRQLLQNRKLRHLWRHNLGSRWKLQKMAGENFSIGAFYNITKNQHNPIKTVGRDRFWAPKPLKIQVFRGHPAPRGRTAPIF